MIANAIFAAAALMLAALFLLTGQLRFLVPYRLLLIHQYGTTILLASAVLFVNLTALVFTLGRRFFLKDTGRKLAHFDRELNAGRTSMPPHLHREELQ
jgi:membrane protein implicated in regulation of membrane protease activity